MTLVQPVVVDGLGERLLHQPRDVRWAGSSAGIHHFGSQAMVVLLAMHLLQVLWAGAYRRPARSTGGSAWRCCS